MPCALFSTVYSFCVVIVFSYFSRFGTCGGLTTDTPAGCIVVASDGSGYISRNPDSFMGNYSNTSDATATSEPGYRLAKVAPASTELSELVNKNLSELVGAENLRNGANVTGDSFYSSQGRIDGNFDDANHSIIDLLHETYPTARSLEMETFWLLHLALCSKVSIKATAAAIVVANRPTGAVIEGKRLDEMEKHGGHAVLKAVCQIAL
jgi:uridine phosphorylase